MKYINVFDKDTDYVSYRDGDGYIKPNVSLSRDTKVVHYNYPMWDTNGKPFVDLELPSGTLWATMNVGASKASDYGQYFQWGDTSGYTAEQVGTGQKKFASDWSDYKFGVSPNFSKYTIEGAKLELEDDAAHANMGGDWHMPSPEQIQELIDNTERDRTAQWGIAGERFTSKKNGNSIFIPAAGAFKDSENTKIRSNVCFWSSMLKTDNISSGQCIILDSDGNSLSDSGNRYGGLSIRGVLG